jgi:hypothetical protein
MSESRHNVFEHMLEISFFDYSLGGYSHQERWARTRRYFFMNNGAKKAKEDLDSIITTIGREFISIKVE